MPDVTPPSPDDFGRVLVLLEDIRAQNKATIEAVESGRRETSLEMQRLETRLTARIEILEAVARHHGEELRAIRSELTALKSDVAVLKSDVAVLKSDVAVLKADVAVLKSTVSSIEVRMERLLNLETRVSALERRTS